jgi:hypothetical protein
MQTANLDIDLLRSFAAVADTGSFTAAADLVARTQSAVSVQVAPEDIVGRQMSSAPPALALAPQGAARLRPAHLELNDESVRASRAAVVGQIRLGIRNACPMSCPPRASPPPIRRARRWIGLADSR